MAIPTNPILVIATEDLGADGFDNKIAPISPVTNLGYADQGLSYQQYNYLDNNKALWLKYITEEQIPYEASRRLHFDTAEASARSLADTVLQTNINNEASTRATKDTAESTARIAADTVLQTNINNEASTRATNDTAESTARIAAYNVLLTRINNEASTRANDDYAIQDSVIGYGQTWQNVKSSRSSGVTYTNSSTKPIFVHATGFDGGDKATIIININGLVSNVTSYNIPAIFIIVPVGNTYSLTLADSAISFNTWLELRSWG